MDEKDGKGRRCDLEGVIGWVICGKTGLHPFPLLTKNNI
jgi:hypothetical protein